MKLNDLFRYNLPVYRVQIAVFFIAAIAYLFTTTLSLWMITLILLMYFVYGCLGVATMFHKYLTHRSYKTTKFIERLFSLFGTLGGTGSSIAWTAMHVEHHKYSDTENDPHSPLVKGVKVFLLDYNIDSKKLNGPSKLLLRDKFHLFLHNYYALIHISWAVFLLIFGINFLFTIYILPMLLTVIMSNYVIYFCHSNKYGYSNFDANDLSRNTLIGGYLVFGEGWHNNHHKYPRKANFREKWWEFDLSYQIVKLIQVNDNVLSINNKQSF